MKTVILFTALLASVSSSQGLMAYIQRRLKKANCPRVRAPIQPSCCRDLEEGFVSKWFFDLCIPNGEGSMMFTYREKKLSEESVAGKIPTEIDVGRVEYDSSDCSGPILKFGVVESGVKTDTCDDTYKYDLMELTEDVSSLYTIVVVPDLEEGGLCSTSSTLTAWFQTSTNRQAFGALIGSGSFCMEGGENRTGFDGNGNILLFPEDNCSGSPTLVTCYPNREGGSVAYGAKLSEYIATYEASVGNTLGKQTYGLGLVKQYADDTCQTEIGFSGSTMYGFCVPGSDGKTSEQTFYLGKADKVIARRLEGESEKDEFFNFLVQEVRYDNPNCEGIPTSVRSSIKLSDCNSGTRAVPKPVELDNLSPELDSIGVGLTPYANGTFWTPTVCKEKYQPASLAEVFRMPDIIGLSGLTFFSSGTCVNEDKKGGTSFRTSSDGFITYFSKVNCTGDVIEDSSGVCITPVFSSDPDYYMPTPNFEFYLGTSLREFAHVLAPDTFSLRLPTEAPTDAPTEQDSNNSDSPSAAPQTASVSAFFTIVVAVAILA